MGSAIYNILDLKLLNEGIDSFNLSTKNELIKQIGDKKGMEYSQITDEYLLDYHKQLKKDLLSNQCEEEILNGFTSVITGHTYRLNRDDQINFIGKYLKVKEDISITSVMWRIEETGEESPHTRDEFIGIYDEGFKHKEDALLKLWELKKTVDNCLTEDEILLIKWQ